MRFKEDAFGSDSEAWILDARAVRLAAVDVIVIVRRAGPAVGVTTGAVRASVPNAHPREAHTAEVERKVTVRVKHAAVGLGMILRGWRRGAWRHAPIRTLRQCWLTALLLRELAQRGL